jgi:hypothetical protein
LVTLIRSTSNNFQVAPRCRAVLHLYHIPKHSSKHY